MSDDPNPERPIPTIQALYDEVFLIFLLSAVIMVVSYTLWGLMEIAVWRGG